MSGDEILGIVVAIILAPFILLVVAIIFFFPIALMIDLYKDCFHKSNDASQEMKDCFHRSNDVPQE